MASAKKKIALLFTQVFLAVALIIGLVGVVGNGSKSVALSVDGQDRTVSTRATDVRGALDDADIQYSARDKISPSLDTALDADTHITVATEKKITVKVNGKERSYTTHLNTVGEFLESLGLPDDAVVSADLDADLVSFTTPIKVTTPKTLVVLSRNGKKTVKTTATTVAAALKDAGVKLGAKDKVFQVVTKKKQVTKKIKGKKVTRTITSTVLRPVSGKTPVTAGMKLRWKKFSSKQVTEKVSIDFSTTTEKDDTLAEGQKKVVTKGEPGKKAVTYQVQLLDGKVIKKIKRGEKVISEATDAVVKVGTKKAAVEQESNTNRASSSKPAANTTNMGGVWQKLAQCESGGNWSINTGNGYYGGLQFSASSWRAAGGTKYAPLPHLATPAEQIATAERLRANGGWGHWPACSARLGLR